MKSAAFLHNETLLSPINASLRPQKTPKTGKIGIFCPSKNGDIATAMSVLRYCNMLWEEKEVIWYCNLPSADLLKHSPCSEIRTYAWEGLEVDPCTQLMDPNTNRLLQDRKHLFEWSADLEEAYFPAPWMKHPEHGLNYTEVSKQVFGVPGDWEWKPFLSFSDEEYDLVNDFMRGYPKGKNILMETSFESGQSGWSEQLTQRTKQLCSQYWGDCNFIMLSELKQFTVRQCALFANYADIIVGVSSGLSVVTSGWGLKNVPRIEFCNSLQCSTAGLNIGRDYHLIAPNVEENILPPEPKMLSLQNRFEVKLVELLTKYV